MTTRSFRLESGANEDGLRIGVRDDASGETLTQFELNHENLWAMLRGGSFRVEGRMTNHLDRIGKTMVNEMVAVPKDITNGLSYTDRDAKLHAGRVWAEGNYPGWDEYQPHHTNTGDVRIVLRKWVSA